MGISRRTAFKVAAATTGTQFLRMWAPRQAEAAVVPPRADAMGMLYDATKCIGCRACMVACNEANDVTPDTELSGGLWQMPLDLNGNTKNIIKLYRDDKSGAQSFVKRQCMHCVDPACTNACMLGALSKGEHGAVGYDPDLCIGCRYCQMSCPFNIPKFEWSSITPKIVKCELCRHRFADGKGPACCEVCPTGAVIYGPRDELLNEAHRRIDAEPKNYVDHVYGEKEVGGTQVLYLSHVPFSKLGLPEYGERSVPRTVRTVQETIYYRFASPIALFSIAAGLMVRNRRSGGEASYPGKREYDTAPAGGPILSRPVIALGMLAVLAGILILWRFAVGLGASTALSDGYPWGLWIAFDVVTGTALGCGGYVMVLLVYLLNRGKYHPLIRPALVTSAFGYSIAGLSVLIDVGRPWLVWKIPLFFWHWNLHSVLLEVALCIMSYSMLMWFELLPSFLERAQASNSPTWQRIAEAWLPRVRASLLWLTAIGVVLPTMHQSSLGSLLLLSGPRLHSLWNTPLLPLLFLISCIGMGFSAVVIESALSTKYFGRKHHGEMLAGLGSAMAWVLGAYLAARIVDLVVRGQLGALFAFDHYSILVLTEMTLTALAVVMMSSDSARRDQKTLFRAAMAVLAAGALYRFDVFLVAFMPGTNWTYFPNVVEILITAGLVAGEVVGYILLVRLFPIMARDPHPAAAK